jgi:hypothetical protein
MNEFNPQQDEWYRAVVYYRSPYGWAFGKLDDGTEIFIPAPTINDIVSDHLAVRLKWMKPRPRAEAIEAMSLENYNLILDGLIDYEPKESA